MTAQTLVRTHEATSTPEQREIRRVSVDELAQRSELMRHAGIPLAVFESVGKDGTGNVWQDYLRSDIAPGNTFKARGAFHAVLRGMERGVTHYATASAGNHAQGLGYAVNQLGSHATIYMQQDTPSVKVDGTQELGGTHVTIDLSAKTFEDAQIKAQQDGAEYLSAFDNYDVIAGQGTAAYEALQARPDTDVLYVTVGGGGLLAGTLEAVDAMKRAGMVKQSLKVVAVMYEGNDSLANTIANGGKPTPASNVDSLPEGSAVQQIGDLPAAMIWQYREHLELEIVSEFELAQTMMAMKERYNEQAEAGYESFPLPETTGMLAATGARKRAQARSMQGHALEQWVSMVTGSNASQEKLDYLEYVYNNTNDAIEYCRKIGARACRVMGGAVGARN